MTNQQKLFEGVANLKNIERQLEILIKSLPHPVSTEMRCQLHDAASEIIDVRIALQEKLNEGKK